jgi:glycosyltransferase involved in cell wall biosynthesis
VDRAGKLAFLRSLSIFSVPALYGEAFGLYVIEALASGVPVVQPRHASFPELVEQTGGGVVCEPGSPKALADALEPLLLDEAHAKSLGDTGRRVVREKFHVHAMAAESVRAYEALLTRKTAPAPSFQPA